MSKHTLSVLVENKPGVLARVAGLFSRRGFNIDSLAVGETEHPGISRITIVVDAASAPLEQVTKQLNKLVHVLKIVELESDSAVKRQLLLVKVRAEPEIRSEVVETAKLFRAKVVDVTTDTVTIEITGTDGKVNAFLEVLEPYGIKELVQSGMVGLVRGGKSMSSLSRHTVAASLPPGRLPKNEHQPKACTEETVRGTQIHGRRSVLRFRR